MVQALTLCCLLDRSFPLSSLDFLIYNRCQIGWSLHKSPVWQSLLLSYGFFTKVEGALTVRTGQWVSPAWPSPPLQTASSWLTSTDGNLCSYKILLIGNKRKLNCSLESVTDGWLHLLLTGTPPERVIEGILSSKRDRGAEGGRRMVGSPLLGTCVILLSPLFSAKEKIKYNPEGAKAACK